MELSNLFQGSAKAWSFAGNLAMPLFDNGLTAAQVDQAKAREQQAAAAYQLAVQNAFSETRAAIVADQVALDKLKAEQQQVTALERQLKLATLRYDNGFSSYLEVLDAQRSLFTSQLNYTQAQSDLLISRVQLYKALGGGWQKPSKS
jgi:multidrug efflux system outer membrane protein